MGFSVRKQSWSELDRALVDGLRTLAVKHGADPMPGFAEVATATAFALDGAYGSPAAFGLEVLIDDTLRLRKWKLRLGRRVVDSLLWVPFGFRQDWLEVADMVVGNPVVLLDTYEGAYDTAEGRAYAERGRLAFAALDQLAPGEDGDRAAIAVEYALEALLREAWDERVPVRVSW